MDFFTGKVVLITGASSGIGATTAELFAQHGAKLVITGRNEEKLEITRQNCVDKGCKEIMVLLGDMTKESDVENITQKTVDRFGTCHIVVSNAGYAAPGGIVETSGETMGEMFDLHTKAAFLLVKNLLPHLIENKGSVVAISSIAGHDPLPGTISYSIAKAALSHLVKAMALDLLKKGVRVNAVSPGAVSDTDMISSTFHIPREEAQVIENEGILQVKPAGVYTTKSEVATTVLFLASDASSAITGQDILLDKGDTLTNMQSCRGLYGGGLFD